MHQPVGSVSNSDFTPGAQVRFSSDLDRYPHFVVPAGTLGTVFSAAADLVLVRIRPDMPEIFGLTDDAEWDNEVQFLPECEDLSRCLEIVSRGLRQGDKVRFAHTCDRLPEYEVPAGTEGEVLEVLADQVNVRVTSAEIPGAEELGNGVQFLPDHKDLHVLQLVQD